MTTLYVVRHCRASGQAPEAPLTDEGRAQAERLADFLAPLAPDRIVASPFRRAIQSAEPLAARLGQEIEVDARLRERNLGDPPIADPFEQLRLSFDDVDLCLPGGESSRAALARAEAARRDLLAHGARRTVVVSHGNLIALLLGRGFAGWQALTNPDVFRVEAGGVARIWS